MEGYVNYNGEKVNLGTYEYLHYISYEKFRLAFESGKLKPEAGSFSPEQYADITYGFMFRFPFPDEDKMNFGQINTPFNREIPITLSKDVFDKMQGGDHQAERCKMSIIFQKPVVRRSDGKHCLALVYRDWATNDLYRMEDDRSVQLLVKEIIKNHISKETDPSAKVFYRNLAARLLKGYRLDKSQGMRQSENNAVGTSLPPSTKNELKAAGNKDGDHTAERKKRIRFRKR